MQPCPFETNRNPKLRCSLLFYPPLQTERWAEAKNSGADMIVFDLEDGTLPARRNEARSHVIELFGTPRSANHPTRLLRINNPGCDDGLRDLLMVHDCATPPDGLILPMVEHPKEVQWQANVLTSRHPGLELVVLIESPPGVRNAADIAMATRGRKGPQVTCLFLGTADFSASIESDLGWDALHHARSEIVMAAREAGIDALFRQGLLRCHPNSDHPPCIFPLARADRLGKTRAIGCRSCIRANSIDA